LHDQPKTCAFKSGTHFKNINTAFKLHLPVPQTSRECPLWVDCQRVVSTTTGDH